MVRLNKNKLPDNVLSDLFVQLNNLIGRLDGKQANKFLYALLGTEERIMLAKRLAIIVMLCEGHSMYKVAKTLKVSPTTVEKLHATLKLGEYDALIPLLKKNSAGFKEIIDIIESILSVGGVMPRYGQARLPKHES